MKAKQAGGEMRLKQRVALLESSTRDRSIPSVVWLDHVHANGEIVATRVNGTRFDRLPGEHVEQLEARAMAMLAVPTDAQVIHLSWVKPGAIVAV